jgi:hypothetical protein
LNTSERLEELLISNYKSIKENNGTVNVNQSSYIQGFMEACLINRSLSRTAIESIINNAHKNVFGVDFQSRQDLEVATDEWLDIPTHIRQNKNIDIDNE